MQYRSSYFIVFATALVLSPLTIRAIDRAEAEIGRHAPRQIAQIAPAAPVCDRPALRGFAVAGQCLRVNAALATQDDLADPVLIAAAFK